MKLLFEQVESLRKIMNPEFDAEWTYQIHITYDHPATPAEPWDSGRAQLARNHKYKMETRLLTTRSFCDRRTP